MTENEIVLSAALAVAFRQSLSIPVDMHEIAAEIAMGTEPSADLIHQVITYRLADINNKAIAIIELFS